MFLESIFILNATYYFVYLFLISLPLFSIFEKAAFLFKSEFLCRSIFYVCVNIVYS